MITDRARLRTYECDGLAHYRVTPALVVVPEDAAQLAAIVRACAEHGVPYVARGSGTGLSGGALPHADGVLIVTSRMRAITAVRREDQRAVVEPGVINLDVTKAATPDGYYYAPDPSSQQICSIGGNVAENSGGAHCLKYGFTTNHVLGADFVTAAGRHGRRSGGAAPDAPGYDLLGAVVGSEGTLGIVTSATVRLVRLPEEVRTLLVGFDSTDQAGAATSAIIAAGIVPGGHRDDGRARDRGGRGRRAAATTPTAPVPCSSSSSTAPRSRWSRSTPRSSGCATRTAPSSSGSPPTRPTAR